MDKSKLFYSEHYDFRLAGFEKLHPFDGRKYSKALKEIKKRISANSLNRISIVERSVTNDELLQVHTPEYLSSLNSKKVISQVVEVDLVKLLPTVLLKKGLLEPAKWATQGTLRATEDALERSAINFNVGGGFHHAFGVRGEGFCFFADAALAIESMQRQGKLKDSDKVIMIDLDAHRGNGFESFYINDPSVEMFDIYNAQAYPGMHPGEATDFPYIIPVHSGLNSKAYMDILKAELPKFLETHKNAKLALYNAGTDIVATDTLGGLNVAYETVVERDRFVVEQLRKRALPTTIMTSGGYSSDSYKLIAELGTWLLS